MIPARVPSPRNKSMFEWATELVSYLNTLATTIDPKTPKTVQLETLKPGAKPAVDGLVMWDAVSQQPVISLNGEWRPITLGSAIPQP